jgi:hypothetical protein
MDRPIALTCLVPFAPSHRQKAACTPGSSVKTNAVAPRIRMAEIHRHAGDPSPEAIGGRAGSMGASEPYAG